MWRRTWSSPSTTRTNCTSAEQRTRDGASHPGIEQRRSPAAGPSGGRESLPDIAQPEADTPGTRSRLTARLNRPGVFSEAACGRPPLVRAGVVRGACKRPGWAEAQHRGIFCVSCLNGSQMLRGRSWVRSQGSAEPAGMRSSTRQGGVPSTSAARAPHGTSPFPVTRVSQSRSAEDMNGARRSPSAARQASHPGRPPDGGDRRGGRLDLPGQDGAGGAGAPQRPYLACPTRSASTCPAQPAWP